MGIGLVEIIIHMYNMNLKQFSVDGNVMKKN